MENEIQRHSFLLAIAAPSRREDDFSQRYDAIGYQFRVPDESGAWLNTGGEDSLGVHGERCFSSTLADLASVG